MYTIDLLQGKCLPQRTRPTSILVAGLILAVPVAAGFLTYAAHVEAGTRLSVQQDVLAGLDQRIARLSSVQAFMGTTRKEREGREARLEEVARALKAHAQWSPALVTLAQHVPAEITLSKLELKREGLPKKPGELGEYAFTLRIGAYVPAGRQKSASIQHLIDRLRLPSALGSQIREFRVVLQQPERINGNPYVFYLLECPFKERG